MLLMTSSAYSQTGLDVNQRIQIEKQQQDRAQAQRDQQIEEQTQRKTIIPNGALKDSAVIDTTPLSSCYPIRSIQWQL